MSVNGNGGREALICEPLRTPVGRFGGVFRDLEAATLASTVIGALIERTGLSGEDVDDVVLGQCSPNAEAPAIGRVAALDAGLPVDVPGVQVDRRCGSALQAVIDGCMRVQTGAADLILAGGVESMSQTEYYSTDLRWGPRMGRRRVGGPSHARARHGGRDQPPGPGRDARNRREPAPRVLDPARGAGRALAALAPARRGGATGRPLRRGDRAGAGQARRSRRARRASRARRQPRVALRAPRGDVEATTPRRPSPPATRAGRTTAPRSAWSPTPRRPPSWDCARSAGWSPGPPPVSRRRRWASAPCPRPSAP